jgi:phage terminase large subunit-like protein
MKLTEAPAKRGRGRPRLYATPQEKQQVDAERKRLRRRAAKEAAELLRGDPAAAAAAIAEAARTVNSRRLVKLPPTETSNPAPLLWTPQPQEFDADLLELIDEGYPNVASGLQYARDVQAGRIVACEWVRKAIDRHHRDMERIGDSDWPFVFDAEAAERACKSTQLFREVKGPRAGRKLLLSPWQRFIVISAFGWIRQATGARRFRYVLCYVPRGNGKTTMAAPLGLYMLALDREGGSEVYAAAVTRQQARLVFDVAQFMAVREPEFRSRYGVQVAAHAITQEAQAGTFRPLSRDASSMDGLNVHFAILDELAQHKTREVHDVLITATGKRSQAMILAITTAGSNQSGIGFEQWGYAQKVLNGEIVDEQFFAILYTIDKDDEWTDPMAWRKANPNWGISVMPDVIEQLCLRAQQVASQQSAFKQKHLNVWTNADVAWMNMQTWNSRADPTLNVADFEGEEVVIGLDLAAKIDLAAKAKLFRRAIDGVYHYYLFMDFFLPEAAVSDGRNDSYATWENDGWLRTCPGEVNDFDLIQQSIMDDGNRFRITDVAYDPWQALQMATHLDQQSIPVIEYRPTVANFSAPMKEIDALVRDGRFHHNGDPVLAWNVSCVRVQEDMKGNIFPRKDRNDPRQKIDGLVAALMAMGRRMTLDATESKPDISFA